jgi:hypothetical protein
MNPPPGQSVVNWNTGAELRAVPGERSQDRAARLCREEACLRCPMGLRLGQDRGRASRHWAKSVFSASGRRIPAAALTVSGAQSVRVVHAITWGTRLAYITGEVPPCPAKTQVRAGYKQDAKSQLEARAAVTASYRHRPQGCQQRQSSPAPRDERQYLKQPIRAPVTGIVSPRAPATKWPTGSFLPVTSWFAKQHPHGDRCGIRRAKHNALGPWNAAACLIRGTACEGSPGAGNPHAGKYSELTLWRQRGGGGLTATPLPTRPTCLVEASLAAV